MALDNAVPQRIGWGLLLAAVMLVTLYGAFGSVGADLYPLRTALGIARGVGAGLVVTWALDLWFDLRLTMPGLLLAVAAIVVLVAASEAAHAHCLARQQRLLIVGGGAGVRDLLSELEMTQTPFLPVGVVGNSAIAGAFDGVPVLGGIDDLPAVIDRERPDLVVLAVDQDRPAFFQRLLDAAEARFRVVELPQFYEHAFGRVPVREVNGAWFMSVLHLYRPPYSRAAKRSFDLAVAVAGLAISVPLLLLLWLAVELTPGPAVLRQERIGENGKRFMMCKFRTMQADAESEGGAVWSPTRDPRVTAVGRVMRRLRVDELPQLWNVLRGEMSIVGPRPERPEFLEQLEAHVPHWNRRHLVKPGLTGWAQINRGYTADINGSIEKLSFDLWYLRHRSLLVDLAICAKTVGIVVKGNPAATAARPPRAPVLQIRPAKSLVADLAPAPSRAADQQEARAQQQSADQVAPADILATLARTDSSRSTEASRPKRADPYA